MAVASGTHIDRQPTRDLIYSVQEIYFGKTRQMHLHCRTHINVIMIEGDDDSISVEKV